MKLLIVAALAALLVGCGDNVVNPVLERLVSNPDQPKKCLVDPCLPGCPDDPDTVCGEENGGE